MRAIAVLMLVCGVFGCAKEAREVPVSDAALSFFEDTPEGCAWKRVEPLLGRTDTLATLSMEKCDLMSIAWSGDGKRALLASPMGVYLWNGTMVESHSVPTAGTRVRKISFDVDGEPEVLLTSTARPCGELRDASGSRDAVEFDCVSGNSPHTGAFPRLRPLAFETVSDDEMLYRLETTAPWEEPVWLRTAGPDGNSNVPDDVSMSQIVAIASEYNRKRMAGLARSAPSASAKSGTGLLAWGALRLPTGLVVAHRDRTLVFEHANRSTFLAHGGPIVESVWFRGDHLLVLETNGTHPRLYDARTGQPVWSSMTATAASFWPKPASPK